MSIAEFCHWLQNTGWATALRESELMFPLLEGSHLLGITLSVGTLLMLDLRLAGILFRDRPVSAISRAVMPVSLAGFAWMFLSGIVLFASQAEKAWGSFYFKLKLLFLLLAGLNALIFELTLRRRIHEWDRDPVPPPRARLAALLAMFFWAGVICAGRTMAYNF
jgi:hypothetical protein